MHSDMAGLGPPAADSGNRKILSRIATKVLHKRHVPEKCPRQHPRTHVRCAYVASAYPRNTNRVREMLVGTKKTVLLAASALLAGPLVANAAFVNDGSYMEDTTTGLYWLNLNSTVDQSYNQVLSETGVGGSLAGWQIATSTQVATLFSDAGIPAGIVSGFGTNTYLAQATNLASAIGSLPYFSPGGGNGSDSYGGFQAAFSNVGSSYGSGNAPVNDLFIYGVPIPTSVGYAIGGAVGYVPVTYAGPSEATFLVSTIAPVPLPSSAWLFLSALCGLGALARHRKLAA